MWHNNKILKTKAKVYIGKVITNFNIAFFAEARVFEIEISNGARFQILAASTLKLCCEIWRRGESVKILLGRALRSWDGSAWWGL